MTDIAEQAVTAGGGGAAAEVSLPLNNPSSTEQPATATASHANSEDQQHLQEPCLKKAKTATEKLSKKELLEQAKARLREAQERKQSLLETLQQKQQQQNPGELEEQGGAAAATEGNTVATAAELQAQDEGEESYEDYYYNYSCYYEYPAPPVTGSKDSLNIPAIATTGSPEKIRFLEENPSLNSNLEELLKIMQQRKRAMTISPVATGVAAAAIGGGGGGGAIAGGPNGQHYQHHHQNNSNYNKMEGIEGFNQKAGDDTKGFSPRSQLIHHNLNANNKRTYPYSSSSISDTSSNNYPNQNNHSRLLPSSSQRGGGGARGGVDGGRYLDRPPPGPQHVRQLLDGRGDRDNRGRLKDNPHPHRPQQHHHHRLADHGPLPPRGGPHDRDFHPNPNHRDNIRMEHMNHPRVRDRDRDRDRDHPRDRDRDFHHPLDHPHPRDHHPRDSSSRDTHSRDSHHPPHRDQLHPRGPPPPHSLNPNQPNPQQQQNQHPRQPHPPPKQQQQPPPGVVVWKRALAQITGKTLDCTLDLPSKAKYLLRTQDRSAMAQVQFLQAPSNVQLLNNNPGSSNKKSAQMVLLQHFVPQQSLVKPSSARASWKGVDVMMFLKNQDQRTYQPPARRHLPLLPVWALIDFVEQPLTTPPLISSTCTSSSSSATTSKNNNNTSSTGCYFTATKFIDNSNNNNKKQSPELSFAGTLVWNITDGNNKNASATSSSNKNSHKFGEIQAAHLIGGKHGAILATIAGFYEHQQQQTSNPLPTCLLARKVILPKSQTVGIVLGSVAAAAPTGSNSGSVSSAGLCQVLFPNGINSGNANNNNNNGQQQQLQPNSTTTNLQSLLGARAVLYD